MNETIKNLHIPFRAPMSEQGITVLAGDVGGTKTNLAIYEATPNGMQLVRENRYSSHKFPTLTEVLQLFLSENGHSKPDSICVGVAGPVLQGKVELTNLNWVISEAELQNRLGVRRVSLINDLESVAYGLAVLKPDDVLMLHAGDAEGKGNMAIVAPGTGLGEAGLYYDGKYHRPFPTEGGHAGFGPRTELDIELYRYLQQKYGVVSWEKVIAGPAIADIFDFLKTVMKRPVPGWLEEELATVKDPSAVISVAGMEEKADICVETMDHFVRYLAYESANTVLNIKATGGLFLGGGIPPKIAPLLQKESFYQHYMDCDRMQHLLETVPIRVIMNDKAGLKGAGFFGAYAEGNS